MTHILIILTILPLLRGTHGAVYLWSNHELKISPLQKFTMDEFSKVVEELEHPEVFFFRSPSRLAPEMRQVTNGFHSAFSPNGDLQPDNFTELLGDTELDILTVKEILSKRKSYNVLSAIMIPDLKRIKRQVDEAEEISTEKPSVADGPVIYKAQNVKNKLYALLYSSKSLILKRNDTEIRLGKTDDDMIIYDNRLNINVIPADGGSKVTLRFSFSKINGYWYLPSVKITDTNIDKSYNLSTDEDIMAPEYFSYHCNGFTVFSDNDGVELYIYDIQVQTDSRNGKFDDANDCVPFTTAPIWSGLFVTTLLGIGLIVALTAIMDIKTMDKFDNHKTKNLAITISE